MAHKANKPISLKFVFFVSAIVIGIFFYATTPDDMKNIKKSTTFNEMLEYNQPSSDVITEEERNISIQNQKKLQEQIKKQQATRPNNQSKSSQPKKQIQQQTNNNSNINMFEKREETAYSGINIYDDRFDDLLTTLAQYPPKNLSSVESIVNKILVYKGYPANTIRIVTDEREELKTQTQGSYIAASFNIQTGCVHINKVALYGLRIQDTVAILAHELDHFDKIAKVCKSMGSDNFIKLLNENKMKDVNTSFWHRAPLKANLKDFDADYYKQALVRFLGQGNMDLASTYADLYRLSENMRNPLELSAYEVSDYVYEYYGIKKHEGPMQKLITNFNNVDWAIYNLVGKNNILNNQRIALFDYFFMQAILDKHPKYSNIYQQCLSTKNGDMTSFWLAFETDNKSLYSKNTQIDKATYENIMSLLSLTEQKAKSGLSDNIVQNALKFKVNTLLNNIVFPNAIKNIQEAASDYIQYAKNSVTKDAKTELKMILTLICIENDLNKNTGAPVPSLYYIKIPSILTKAYGTVSDSKKFHFIYNNQAFKEEFNARKASIPSLTEQTLLTDLISENRLFIKF